MQRQDFQQRREADAEVFQQAPGNSSGDPLEPDPAHTTA
jgi:hypothetical protein